MSWIKRNLYFLVGTLVALMLMGAAGWYLYTQWQTYGDNREKLNKDYADLDGLNKQSPHPGARDINNITNAQGQTKEWLSLGDQARHKFDKIPAIPDMNPITDQGFSAALSRTINQLQRDATNASVALLTPGYSFSFEAQNSKMSFAPGSLEPLSVQLGEVRAICDLLFKAKINSLVSIKRERISADDQAANPTDYLGDQTQTNEQAVLTPYLVAFHCFSPELAAVLAGFANSPHGFLVKTINVERGAPAPVVTDVAMAQPVAANPQPMPVVAAPDPRRSAADAADAFAKRYGMRPGGSPGDRMNRPRPVAPTPSPTAAAPAAPVRTGPMIVLDEGQLKVEMVVEIIKVLEPKKAAAAARKSPR